MTVWKSKQMFAAAAVIIWMQNCRIMIANLVKRMFIKPIIMVIIIIPAKVTPFILAAKQQVAADMT